jgi:hypothetical protein
MNLSWLAALLPLLLAVLLFGFAVAAFRRRSPASGLTQFLVGVIMLALAVSISLAALGMQGYRTLTLEQTAAVVQIEQTAPQRFTAHFRFPDDSRASFELAGDELYVDARILKWHPRANLLGLRTGYQLDRVAGRYQLLDDEQTAPRTVHALGSVAAPDLFSLVRRYPLLERIVDAEYGSASFLSVSDGGSYQIRVSTSGLLIRRLPQ